MLLHTSAPTLGMERDELGGRKWKQQRVRLIGQEGERVLLLYGCPYMSWKTEDDLSPRLAVAQMCRLGLVSQEELAQIFGISNTPAWVTLA